MSYINVRALAWATAQDLKSPAQKAVLQSLARHSDCDGFTWPSQETIAAETSLTSRTVRSALKALETAGLIAREKRGSKALKTRTSDLILLDIPAQALTPKQTHTGNKRRPYRKELPTNNTGNNRYYPYQEEKFSEGSRLEDTHEYDPGSNVVPFPIDGRDAA